MPNARSRQNPLITTVGTRQPTRCPARLDTQLRGNYVKNIIIPASALGAYDNPSILRVETPDSVA
jgi:hypothetical protein